MAVGPRKNSESARSPSPMRADAGRATNTAQAKATDRDELYRDNQRHRDCPVLLAPGGWDDTTPVSVLGLEQMTISRLHRTGIDRLAQLLDVAVEDLWRSIGRHGITDIMRCLEYQGLSLRPLDDYGKWRLGLVKPQQVQLTVTPDSPVSRLWPKLGFALTELLQKRGRSSVADLAPQDSSDLLQLYRLGKGNLRKIEAVLEQLARQAEGVWRDRLDRALHLIAARSRSRTAGREPYLPADPADRHSGPV